MKKIIISSLAIAFICMMAQSCKKKDINGDAKTLVSGSYITADSVLTMNLDFSVLTATVGVKIGEKGSPVASVDIFLAKGDDAKDSSEWVLIKNVAFTPGMILTVSTAELATALSPDVITPGNQYVLQNVVHAKDGRTFSVTNTPDTYNSFPNYHMLLSWKAVAVCAYTGNASMVGKYTVVEDDWVDWHAGDEVTVAAGTKENQLNLSQVWPNPSFGTTVDQLLVTIDPVTGAATIPKGLVWGDYGYKAEVSPDTPGTGFVFSCTGVISLSVPIFAVGYGEQGSFKLILKKK